MKPLTPEFQSKGLSELTLHHGDHNHDNNHDNPNPNDGSNWELLYVYCQGEARTKFENLVRYGSTTETEVKAATFNPFADLKATMDGKNRDWILPALAAVTRQCNSEYSLG